jgi:thioredoxin-related protein
MRTLRILSLVCLCALLASSAPAAEGLVFQADYAKAAKEAKKAGKGMVVEFETAWCPFCRAMEKKTFPDKAVREAASKLVLAKVDADTQTMLAKKFRVGEEFPLFVFLTPEGDELFRFAGYQPPTSFARALQSVADPDSELQKARRAAEEKPKDAAAQLALGDSLYEVGAVGQAADAYEIALKGGLEGDALERAGSRRAEHLRDAEKWSDAAALYLDLLKQRPGSERAPFYRLGLVETYIGWGRDSKAEAEAKRLAETHPDHPATARAASLLE